MKRLLIALFAALALAGCGVAQPGKTGSSEMSGGADEMSGDMVMDNAEANTGEAEALPTVTPGEVTVVNVMSNVTTEGVLNGAAYLTVLNGLDQPITLTSAEVDPSVAKETTMHETVDDNGVLRMLAKPEGFAIPAGGSLTFDPGNKHIMLENLSGALTEGSEYTLTLNFDGADAQTVTVPVLPFGTTAVDHEGMEMDGMDHEGMEMDTSAIIRDVEALDGDSLHELDESLAAGARLMPTRRRR